MIERPRLKTYVTLFPIAEDLWGLQGGREELWRIQLRGKEALSVFSALLPRLDGSQTVDEIVATLTDAGLREPAVRVLLKTLESKSLLEEGGQTVLDADQVDRFAEQLTFFSHFSTRASDLQRRLLDAHVAVIGNGRLAGALVDGLENSGVGRVTRLATSFEAQADSSSSLALMDPQTILPSTRSDDSDAFDRDWPDLFLVTRQSQSSRLPEAINRACLERETPWLLIEAVSAKEGLVGPLFLPGETGCFACMETRLRSNLHFHDEHVALQEHLSNGAFAPNEATNATAGNGHRPPPACGSLHGFQQALAGIAVTEAVKFLTSLKTPQLAGRALSLDLFGWTLELHDILKVPRCPVCRPQMPEPFAWRELPYEKQ